MRGLTLPAKRHGKGQACGSRCSAIVPPDGCVPSGQSGLSEPNALLGSLGIDRPDNFAKAARAICDEATGSIGMISDRRRCWRLRFPGRAYDQLEVEPL